MARIVLELDGELTPDDRERLRYLLRDAFGEFVAARGGDACEPIDSRSYVARRYPTLWGERHNAKVEEVLRRKSLARRLRRAVDQLRFEE